MKSGFFILIVLFLIGTGCFSHQQQLELEGYQLPMPTKDEVARVNGIPFTLSEFVSIRKSLSTRSSDKAYWIGVAALTLVSETQSRKNPLNYSSALELAKYAAFESSETQSLESPSEGLKKNLKFHFPTYSDSPSPQQLKAEIEKMTQKIAVVKNPFSLSD